MLRWHDLWVLPSGQGMCFYGIAHPVIVLLCRSDGKTQRIMIEPCCFPQPFMLEEVHHCSVSFDAYSSSSPIPC